MKSLKRWIRNYFHFNQRETNGFILLIFGLIIIVSLPYWWPSPQPVYDPRHDQQILDSLAAQLKSSPYENKPYAYNRRDKKSAPVKPIPPEFLRPFDPNTLTQAQWEKFGLPAYVAKRLLTYRDKAQGFKYKDQIKRIYGFPPELYAQLEPYITLPGSRANQPYADARERTERAYPSYANKPRTTYSRERSRLPPFDINTADTTALKKLRGIGTKLAARIVKFRDKLGGFENINQLQEVYGLPPEMIDSLRKYTFVGESFAANKLNINVATVTQLQQHPYLGYKLARHIVAYRTQHGPFASLEDLRNIKTIDDATFQKVKPYLTF
ncbi:ComEA family DNA-binding protein [Adhaeribacter pallidiroseus]|uniref:Endonuclease/exonuclease/phosphatase family domain-containing protein n=1 Tax=Adhaeribacter pallidiroseus TaxID=2072847 RepID=A0A369QS24_9BACT|nr:helix-hairpin-helix domain-containing protein [Adhaeribacter pallidiroseus]RDC66126.1 Endonuclease/exonuclease/phosphatase family domain-containing protein [Adhaeribacter pallidiroseus]